MKIAVDYDDVWTAAPDLFEFLARAIRKAGGEILVLTGNPDAADAVKDTEVVVLPYGTDDPTEKAAVKATYLDDHGFDLLIDDGTHNVLAALHVTNAALFLPHVEPDETRAARRELAEMRRRLRR